MVGSSGVRTDLDMKLLFLDFDGVIRLCDDRGLNPRFDPSACKGLLAILRSVPGLWIMVSSDMRDHGLEFFLSGLRDAGLAAEDVDFVRSRLYNPWCLKYPAWGGRWQMIEEVVFSFSVEDLGGWVILDDSARLFDPMPKGLAEKHLFLCDGRHGLVDSVVRRAIALLSGEPRGSGFGYGQPGKLETSPGAVVRELARNPVALSAAIMSHAVSEPQPGSLWKHLNGNLYRVDFLTNDPVERQDRYPRTVVYHNEANGNRYSRKLSDWHRSMTALPLSAKPEEVAAIELLQAPGERVPWPEIYPARFNATPAGSSSPYVHVPSHKVTPKSFFGSLKSSLVAEINPDYETAEFEMGLFRRKKQ